MEQYFPVLREAGAEIIVAGTQFQGVPWSEPQEAALLAGFYIGIMPLPDDPWERGECGYKLIQYMACGVPVVARAVDVSREIVCSRVSIASRRPGDRASGMGAGAANAEHPAGSRQWEERLICAD